MPPWCASPCQGNPTVPTPRRPTSGSWAGTSGAGPGHRGRHRPWGAPSLVLCGDRSADRGTGALPAFLAHELGAAQALGLVSLEADPASADAGRAVLAQRRLDGGWRERLTVPLPAVCSVEGAGVRLRRASLEGALAAAGSAVAAGGLRRWPGTAADGPTPAVRVGASRPFRPGPACCLPPRARIPASGCWP